MSNQKASTPIRVKVHGTTSEFAQQNLVKPESVRTRYCLTGEYMGIRPVKLRNGRLAWPLDSSQSENGQEVAAQ